MISGPSAWRGSVPPIPAARLDPVAEEEGVLLWVRHGTATVTVDGGVAHVARGGEAVWLPPGLRHSAVLEPGSVALPIIAEVDGLPDSLARAGVVTVPPAWQDWLLYRISRWFGFAGGARPDRSRLVDLLVGTGPADRTPLLPPLPPMPRSPGPRSVVERMLRDPAGPEGPAELAAGAMISSRTLQRRLAVETGHSLGQWRTAIRVAAAASYLAQGRGLGWTAHQVGYGSVSGFAHAFASRVGLSPGRYAAVCARPERTADPLVTELAALVAPAAAAPAPPVIPAVPPSSWVRPFDSVLWVYRGPVSLEIAGRSWDLRSGDVVRLPQGVPHLIGIAEGAVLLPLGRKPAGPGVRVDPPQVVRMPDVPEIERFLLHTVVANHFLLRPPGHDDQAFLDLLHPAGPAPEWLPAHLEEVVSTVIANPSDRRSLAEWAGTLAVDPGALRRDFAAVMGESFPRWRAKARMTEARALMWNGHPPTSVARRLGYAHLPAFSKAFTAAHGMPPREWVRRQTG